MILLPLILAAAPAAAPQSFTLLTSSGPIGTMTVDRKSASVDVDWRVDENGRGPKIKEHVELGDGGLPRQVEIEGTVGAGALVKESFSIEGQNAQWKSLDDHGEAPAKDALYLANNGTPWEQALYLEVLLAAKDHRHAVLPAGEIRLEKLRDVTVGSAKDALTAYAIWGLDVAPSFLLARSGRMVAAIAPGKVLVEDAHKGDFAELSALAASLSSASLKELSARLTHSFSGPLWLVHARVFDPLSGTLSPAKNVGVFGDTIVAVGDEPPPADAAVVDCAGGALLPGLIDAHDHFESDWAGPLHMATGVTFGRDPGNDNQSLLSVEARIRSGEIMGPRLTNSGFLEGKSPFSAHAGFVIETLEEAKEKVHWYANHGYWGLKIYNSMNPDFVKPIAEEAHRLGLHVSGHVPAFMSSERALRDGYDEIHHINQLMLSFVIDPLKEDTRTPLRVMAIGQRLGGFDLASAPLLAMVKLMKERKTTLDPTMAVFSRLMLTRPGQASPADATWLDHMPMAVQRGRRTVLLPIKPEEYPTWEASWKKLEQTLVMLHKEGIPLVPGTDDPLAGLFLHSELETWVRAGIPAGAVLRMATLGGAQLLGLDGRQGAIARGKLADLYLVDGDPTQDIGTIRKGRMVVKGGNVYYPDEIFEALGIKPFAAHAAMVAPPAAGRAAAAH